MSKEKNPSFLRLFKEADIKSNKASIWVHRDMILNNLNIIENNNPDTSFSSLTKKHINILKDIKEDDLWLNVIEPMIGISLALYLLFDSIIKKDISLVQSHKKEFKEVLISTLSIAKHLKDQRVNDNSTKATKVFLEKVDQAI